MRQRRRGLGLNRSHERENHFVDFFGDDVADDVEFQSPARELSFDHVSNAIQRQRLECLLVRVHDSSVFVNHGVDGVMREQLDVLVRVNLKHAVNVLDALERLLVPRRLRQREVHDLENSPQASIRGERGIQKHVLDLGLDVVHEQVLHRQELDLLARPFADVASLLHGAQTDRRRTDSAGPDVRALNRTTTRDDES